MLLHWKQRINDKQFFYKCYFTVLVAHVLKTRKLTLSSVFTFLTKLVKF